MKPFFLSIPILFVLVITLPETSTAAEPVLKISRVYYEVKIDDDQPIILAALKASPILIEGRKQLSRTTCKNRYTYNAADQEDKTCQVEDYEVTVDCEMLLPRFEGLPAKFRPQVDTYLEKAEEYELQHIKINVDHMRKFAAKLAEQPTYACGEVDGALKAEFEGFSALLSSAAAELDKKTTFGRTAGADLQWHLATEDERLLIADDRGVCQAEPVESSVEYVYNDFMVDKMADQDNWMDEATISIKVNYKLRYQPYVKSDGTCRVLHYDLKAPCRIDLPRFVGVSPAQVKESDALVNDVKNFYSDICRFGTRKADELASKITGEHTFKCDTMAEDVEAMITEFENQVQAKIDGAPAAYVASRAAEPRTGPAADHRENLKVDPKVKYKYYDVKVTGREQALKEAWESTRLSVNDQKSLTATAFDVKFKYKYEKLDKNYCRITEPDLNLECTLHLPRLSNSDPQVQEALAPLQNKIEAAEMKRCQIAAGQADLLIRDLAERSFPCPALGNRAKGLLNDTVKEAKRLMNQYVPDYEN